MHLRFSTSAPRALRWTPLLLMMAVSVAWAAKPPVQVDRDGIAVRGYDVVAYITDGAAVRGDRAHAYDWQGATWYFASAESRERFVAEPEAYAPQYGGYCAYAVAQGSTAAIDPEAFTVRDGKLYLNYSQRVMKKWSKDIPGNIAKADRNWPGVLQ